MSMHGDAADVASRITTGLTAPALLISGNCIVAYAVRRSGPAAWLPIAASPFVAMATGATFSRLFPQHYAPDCPEEACFPSGHTTGLTAEAATLAYVLHRENVFRGRTAALILFVAVIGGLNRLYRDRHWATDIIGGWSAGIAVAACCALLSEWLPAFAPLEL